MDKYSKEVLSKLAENYQISDYMDYFEYVPAAQIPEILNHSSILLQLANKMSESGPKGIMTTKLFEALAVEKPILCVRSDEAYLEETINKTHSGIAARTEEEVYQFILTHYKQWEKEGYTYINVERENVKPFSRQKQADQFMQLFTHLNHK